MCDEKDTRKKQVFFFWYFCLVQQVLHCFLTVNPQITVLILMMQWFPEVMVDMNDTLINRMYGYAQPMQADFSRDSVTPLDTSKKLTFKVNPYDSEVKSFSYEIRTSDGSKVLENKKIKNLVKEDQYLSVDVEIGSDLRMNQDIHADCPGTG